MAKLDTGLFKLQWKDAAKGLLVAMGSTLLSGIYNLISAGHIPTWIEFKPYLLASISAGIAYVIKNYLTNNADQILKPNVPVVTVPKEDVKPEALGDDGGVRPGHPH